MNDNLVLLIVILVVLLGLGVIVLRSVRSRRSSNAAPRAYPHDTSSTTPVERSLERDTTARDVAAGVGAYVVADSLFNHPHTGGERRGTDDPASAAPYAGGDEEGAAYGTLRFDSDDVDSRAWFGGDSDASDAGGDAGGSDD
jgi:hypothetical protein